MLKAGENRLLSILLTTSIGNSRISLVFLHATFGACGHFILLIQRRFKNCRSLWQNWMGEKLPQPVAEIPWGHNALLLEKLSSPVERIWYARKTIENGWSRNILTLQIESGLFHRQGKAVSNFKKTLPPLQSDLAQQMLKDPYVFNFLTIDQKAHERAVEKELVNHITRFLLELGAGFAFVGKQFHLEVSGQDFYIDLLFIIPGCIAIS